MSISQVGVGVSNSTGSGTTTTLTWDGGAPANGKLLLIGVATEGGTPSLVADFGFTLLDSQVGFHLGALYGKIASSEGTTQAVPISGAAQGLTAVGAQFTGQLAGAFAGVLDQHTGDVRTGSSGAALATGTTGATAQADELAVAMWSGYDLSNPSTWSGYTASFTEVIDVASAGPFLSIALAIKTLSATGAQTCTATPSISMPSATAHIATFKAAAAAATVVQQSYSPAAYRPDKRTHYRSRG